jgi:hypothetical protein
MNAKSIRKAVATVAAAAMIGLAAGTAHAAVFNFDHDPADLVNAQASLTLAGVNWGQEIGTTRVQGRLTGTLTYHGGFAGCAKVRMQWKTGTGSLLSTDFSPEVCSNTSLPSVPVSFADSHLQTGLARGTVALLIKPFNGGYSVVASRSMEAGGN